VRHACRELEAEGHASYRNDLGLRRRFLILFHKQNSGLGRRDAPADRRTALKLLHRYNEAKDATTGAFAFNALYMKTNG